MKASRNDPCPCGSGKKYKACCLPRDLARTRAARTLGADAVAETEARVGEAARQAPFWEADVVPLTGGAFTETGTPGALAIIGAEGYVLTGEVLTRRLVGAADRAQAVLAALMSGARDVGVLPERLHVRDEALAGALRAELEQRGCQVKAAPLPELDEAVDAALERLAGSVAGGKTFTLWNWAETEATGEGLADFHAAAAEYHRAAPWNALSDGHPLVLRFPGEDEPCVVSVMGGAGIYYGLALYSHAADVEALHASEVEDTDVHVGAMAGFSLSLSYEAAGELPKPMRREVLAAGWDVAGQDAFPRLMGIAIAGRRLTAEHLRLMARACRTVVAFVQALPSELPWTAPTGAEVTLLFAPQEDAEEIVLPWPALTRSHPVGPAGPNADIEASIRVWQEDWEDDAAAEWARVDRFTAWIEAQNPSNAARGRDARVAELWTDALIASGVPAQSATEYDLRMFLYDFLPAERIAKPVAKHLTRSLRRLFQFHAEQEGIEYPWAEGVLSELDQVSAGAEDVRDVLNEVRGVLGADILIRALRPAAEVPGTRTGWMIVVDQQTSHLRFELHRRWLAWHDEVVRGGITDTRDVRDIILGRQRQWENTPHARHEGRTPKQVLMDMSDRMAEALSQMARL
jgi:SEC-C motif